MHGGKRRCESLQISEDRFGEFAGLVEALRENGPALVSSVGAPRIAVFLDCDECGMQVLNVRSGTHEILSTFDQANALGAFHGDAVGGAPLFRRSRDHHVCGGAFENLGEENIEHVAHALEHGELFSPLAQCCRFSNIGFSGDCSHLVVELGQSILREAVDTFEDIGDLLLRANDVTSLRG